ncbi:MAG TPA: response regulator, partial [Candidatus Omnitrophota bacterium]|nr:response regulator [Candidatus Omnitrophota bacterium]
MGKKILIVDDEPDLLRITCFRLETLGYTILSAVNGQDALMMAERERPDLILLDLRLPVMNGFEVCKKLRSDEELKKIPIILFTASTLDLKNKAQEAGVED